MIKPPNPFDNVQASVASLPWHSCDGSTYGGGAVLVIGEQAIPFGECHKAKLLANELAKRWNAFENKTHEEGGAV